MWIVERGLVVHSSSFLNVQGFARRGCKQIFSDVHSTVASPSGRFFEKQIKERQRRREPALSTQSAKIPTIAAGTMMP